MTDAAEPFEDALDGTSSRKAAAKSRSGQVMPAVLAVLVIPVVVAAALAVWTLRDVELNAGTIVLAAVLVIALIVSVLVAVRIGKKIRRHIDDVHRHADRRAQAQSERVEAEQKGMREAYSSVFVNLSRRSQGLVQRQLTLIEQLERDEEDADRLAILFQLDHLATRMRRNNENLVMLSGAEAARRGGRPVSAGDVLRAAVSEIEQYQRVVVQNPPAAHVAGHAATDVMRLLAELIENATAFSPPGSRVVMSSKKAPNGGLLVEVIDSGIGMTPDELTDANARMTRASSMDMVTSKRMGLFVVGRLAGKHKIDVRLVGRSDGGKGVRASVMLPPELVVKPVAELPRRGGTTTADPRSSSGGAAGAAAGTALFAAGAAGSAAKPKAETGPAVQYRRSKKGTDASAKGTPSTGTPATGKTAASGRQEMPGGRELFKPEIAPLSDWWKSEQEKGQSVPGQRGGPSENGKSGAAIAGGVKMRREQTPIFDQLSAWFVERPATPTDGDQASDQAKPSDETGTQKPRHAAAAKETAADADAPKAKPRHAAASDEKPTETDTAKTSPKPSVAEDETDKRKPSPTRRTPDAKTEDTAPKAETPAAKDVKAAEPKADAQPNAAATPSEERPTDEKPAEEKPAAKSEEAAKEKSWGSATDSQWREVAKVTEQAKPAELTEAGLPKRDRGARLLPGAAANAPKAQQSPSTSEEGVVPKRDAEAIRSRLSGFQRGVKRGKYDATRPARNGTRPAAGTQPAQEKPDQPEPAAKSAAKQQPDAPKQPKAKQPEPKTPQQAKKPLPQRSKTAARKTQKPGVVLPEPRQAEPMPNETGDPWEFSSAAAWEEAKAVADARPQQFTDKGLPKRKRGERLMPGGVTQTAPGGRKPPPVQAARPSRDPNVVRSRLAGFQQGVRRGKQNATEAKNDTGATEQQDRAEVSGVNKEGA